MGDLLVAAIQLSIAHFGKKIVITYIFTSLRLNSRQRTNVFNLNANIALMLLTAKFLMFFNQNKCSCDNSSSILRFAISKYVGSFSIPIYFRFSFIAATHVEPLPMQLSRITSPLFVYVLIR